MVLDASRQYRLDNVLRRHDAGNQLLQSISGGTRVSLAIVTFKGRLPPLAVFRPAIRETLAMHDGDALPPFGLVPTDELCSACYNEHPEPRGKRCPVAAWNGSASPR